MIVEKVGPSLAKVVSDFVPGLKMDELLSLTRPLISLTYANLQQYRGQLCIFDLRSIKLQLRGQMLDLDVAAAAGKMVFLGSPVITGLEEMTDLGLGFKDFATHDPIVDYLFLLQSVKQTMSDAKKFSDELAAVHLEQEKEKINVQMRALQAEKESAEKINRLSSAFIANAIDAIMIMDDKGIIVEFNPAAEKIFGYSRNEVIGRSLSEVIIPVRLRAQHVSGLQRYLNIGKEHVPNKRVEMPALRRDGTEFPAEVVIVRIHSEGRPLFTSYIRDITERKKAAEAEILKREKEAAEAANTELEAFSYSVSHDLRAPLRAIDGFSKILLTEAKELSGDNKEFLERICYNTKKMGQLIDDLLAFSHLGRLSMTIQKIDMSVLVKQTLEEFRDEISNRHIEIRQETLPPCQGDMALLKQVWINLLSNALKYSRQKEKALIEIGTKISEYQKETVYFVKDNGAGFDMHYVDKLFGVFQRLHRAEDFEGTGVGLAIVKRVIERHGGRIWAEAEVNQGATFYFTLQKENKV